MNQLNYRSINNDWFTGRPAAIKSMTEAQATQLIDSFFGYEHICEPAVRSDSEGEISQEYSWQMDPSKSNIPGNIYYCDDDDDDDVENTTFVDQWTGNNSLDDMMTSIIFSEYDGNIYHHSH